MITNPTIEKDKADPLSPNAGAGAIGSSPPPLAAPNTSSLARTVVGGTPRNPASGGSGTGRRVTPAPAVPARSAAAVPQYVADARNSPIARGVRAIGDYFSGLAAHRDQFYANMHAREARMAASAPVAAGMPAPRPSGNPVSPAGAAAILGGHAARRRGYPSILVRSGDPAGTFATGRRQHLHRHQWRTHAVPNLSVQPVPVAAPVVSAGPVPVAAPLARPTYSVAPVPTAASTLGVPVDPTGQRNDDAVPQRPVVGPRGPDAMAEAYNSRDDREARNKLAGQIDDQVFRLGIGGANSRSKRGAIADLLQAKAGLIGGGEQLSAAAVQGRAQRANTLENTGLEQAGEDRRAELGADTTLQVAQMGDSLERVKLERPTFPVTADGSSIKLSPQGQAEEVTDAQGKPFRMPLSADKSGQITPKDVLNSLTEQLKAAQSAITPDADTITTLKQQIAALQAAASGEAIATNRKTGERVRLNPTTGQWEPIR